MAPLAEKFAPVIPVDTFHDAAAKADPEFWRARADALRKDFAGTCTAMVRGLFHEDADPALVKWVERRMLRMDPEIAAALMGTFATYDLTEAGGMSEFRSAP